MTIGTRFAAGGCAHIPSARREHAVVRAEVRASAGRRVLNMASAVTRGVEEEEEEKRRACPALFLRNVQHALARAAGALGAVVRGADGL
jgi:hypothetical protein